MDYSLRLKEQRHMWCRLIAWNAFFIFSSLPVMASDALSTIQNRGKLTVGVKTDYPPWGMLNANGQIVGFEPDLAKAVAEKVGVDLELLVVNSSNRLHKLNEGDVDLLIATLGDTVSRRALVTMIEPHYFNSGVSLVSHKSYQLRNWESLKDKPVCLTNGAYFNKPLIQQYLIKPVIMHNTRDAQLALITKKCIGWAYDNGILAHLLTQSTWQAYETELPVILPVNWGMAVSKNQDTASLETVLSQLIVEWLANGFLLEKAVYWKLPDYQYLVTRKKLWSYKNIDGKPLCSRLPNGNWPVP
ncbi:transporter substrate-binding domain-containing protein [Endozoicomonas sp. SM1973]|uniref:Transporter substrate-binding domain-containing protein n=1 Tax=Spartinivicinus marinus TaxID=2994442 RepID=A0A853I4R3_9GAMM|nr:transporter substrate-binding domain-containing protein [Spartinivicinus marinus]MCX4029559.1 transporter substrate-binding domain-containing protein [Spartinivicinus marinus]NYZ65134.1 transporter substrate-binding domain-containing protein [Spartinivicinus marinus]